MKCNEKALKFIKCIENEINNSLLFSETKAVHFKSHNVFIMYMNPFRFRFASMATNRDFKTILMYFVTFVVNSQKFPTESRLMI